MEEDIKFIKYYINEYVAVDDIGIEDDFKFQDAIAHLIKEYEELKEIEQIHRQENGELRKQVKELEEENQQLEAIKDEAIRRYNLESIPTSLVKEKIEEIKNETWYIDSGEEAKQSCVEELQELLEKRK